MKSEIKYIIENLRELWLKYRRVVIFLLLIVLSTYGAWMMFGRLFILAVCLYVAHYVWKHRRELANTKLEDWVNPLKWGSVLFASFTKLLFPIHIIEQLILRMYDNECHKCMLNGSCFHCGCDMSKVYTPWDVCSRGFWGRMIESKKEYAEVRKEFPVKILITYPMEEVLKPMESVGQDKEVAHTSCGREMKDDEIPVCLTIETSQGQIVNAIVVTVSDVIDVVMKHHHYSDRKDLRVVIGDRTLTEVFPGQLHYMCGDGAVIKVFDWGNSV